MHLATPLLSALAWVAVRAEFDKLDDVVFTPVGYWSSVLASVPVGAVVAGAALFDNAVVLAGAAVLVLGFLGMLLCVRRPWHPFAWLNDHRYMDWDPQKEKEGDDSASDHRSRGTHVLSKLRADREQPGEVEEGSEPPGLHRLAVNAFLDDLHHAYGVSGRRVPWPRRGRRQRPVLIFEADTVDRVTVYFVRLVEDERLRRSYPGPLVLVQVRGRGTPSVIDSPQDPARYRVLPEASGHEPVHLSLHDWSRARQAAGGLGVTRLLRQPVGTLSENDEDLFVPTRVFTVPALTGFWSAGAVGFLVVSYLVVPPLAQRHECVDEGLFVPEGITTVGGWGDRACVGGTYGDFVFDDRLEEISEEIEKQNTQVDESDQAYVTIAYMAEMDTPGDDTYNTAVVQGELLAPPTR